MALAFDTHKAIKGLKEAGFEEAQAEAVVATVGEAMSGNVATKSDIAGLEIAIVELKAELKGDISELKGDVYRHMWIMGGTIIAATVGLVKLLP